MRESFHHPWTLDLGMERKIKINKVGNEIQPTRKRKRKFFIHVERRWSRRKPCCQRGSFAGQTINRLARLSFTLSLQWCALHDVIISFILNQAASKPQFELTLWWLMTWNTCFNICGETFASSRCRTFREAFFLLRKYCAFSAHVVKQNFHNNQNSFSGFRYKFTMLLQAQHQFKFSRWRLSF